MRTDDREGQSLPVSTMLGPAAPLWRLAPTRDGDGRCLADFMMLIPGLGASPDCYRDHVAMAVRGVCESFGKQVAFADINYAINVLWISLDAEPGLGARVAAAIRDQVPQALLVGGQLAVQDTRMTAVRREPGVWQRFRRRWQRVRLLE